MKWASYRLGLLLNLGVGLMVVWLAYQLTDRFRPQVDMTEEKRYTLSSPSQAVLQSLNQEVLIEVYLSGEMPSNFKRFQKAIEELLDGFSIHAASSFSYRFIDPSQAASAAARNRFYQGLMEQGLQPSSINYTKDGNTSQKMVFPGAIVSYGGQELPVNLLVGNRSLGVEQIINQSIENLEYAFINTLKQLSSDGRKRIGLVTGHQEPDTAQLAALSNLLLSRYDLFRVNLPERRSAITGYDLLLITKPTSAFSENEKYLLDQFVMKGGRVAFFLDALRVNMDSASGEGTIAMPYDINLADLLFRYGIRLNPNYVVDLNCGDFPVVTGNIGEQPQIQMLPWPYFPIITTYADNPAVKRMDAVMVRFGSTLDTVKADGITKTPLMMTSSRTRVMGTPVRVAFNDLQGELRPDKFTTGPKPLAYLLEGSFTSLYRNRLAPAGFTERPIEQGQNSKIIVVADGDLIRNELDLENGKPLPLGTSPYSQTTYANDQLILSLVDYLLDEEGLMEVRRKEVKVRPLDKAKVKEERLTWQVINLVLPVVGFGVFGLAKMMWRRRRNR